MNAPPHKSRTHGVPSTTTDTRTGPDFALLVHEGLGVGVRGGREVGWFRHWLHETTLLAPWRRLIDPALGRQMEMPAVGLLGTEPELCLMGVL